MGRYCKRQRAAAEYESGEWSAKLISKSSGLDHQELAEDKVDSIRFTIKMDSPEGKAVSAMLGDRTKPSGVERVIHDSLSHFDDETGNFFGILYKPSRIFIHIQTLLDSEANEAELNSSREYIAAQFRSGWIRNPISQKAMLLIKRLRGRTFLTSVVIPQCFLLAYRECNVGNYISCSRTINESVVNALEYQIFRDAHYELENFVLDEAFATSRPDLDKREEVNDSSGISNLDLGSQHNSLEPPWEQENPGLRPTMDPVNASQ